MIKPELFFPGGREYVRMQRSGGGLTVSVGPANRLYGLSAAAPDPRGQGRLDQVAYSGGTSSSTAMATRAGHRIFDELMNREDGSLLADMDPQFYPVVVKSLLVHSARWNGNAEMLKDICGPENKRRHVERADNSARFLGYGVPNVARVVECTSRRATLVGYQTIVPETAHNYRIPLPGSLERVTDPRLLTITIAWFSPVKAGHQNYRGIRMEAEPLGKPIVVFGVERSSDQPADATGKRGSIFHEHFEGEAAVPYVDDGHLTLRVWCKEDAGTSAGTTPVRYAVAVTIEAGTELPVYDEIKTLLRVRPQP